MKKLLLVGILLSTFLFSQAQYSEPSVNTKANSEKPEMDINYHNHKGFYLSMSLGMVGGTINTEVKNGIKSEWSGLGTNFDWKLGGAVNDNLLLHATLISSSVSGPSVKIGNAAELDAPNNVSISEVMFGVGLTYYLMPANVFLSGSVGLGTYTINDANDDAVSTDNGFSMQLKMGKEWWVSKNWGLGLSASYMKTALTNQYDGIDENIDSNRFAISFNATFN